MQRAFSMFQSIARCGTHGLRKALTHWRWLLLLPQRRKLITFWRYLSNPLLTISSARSVLEQAKLKPARRAETAKGLHAKPLHLRHRASAQGVAPLPAAEAPEKPILGPSSSAPLQVIQSYPSFDSFRKICEMLPDFRRLILDLP